MSEEELLKLSREELVEIVLAQAQRFAILETALLELQAEVKKLQGELEKRQKPPTDSSNSSQPPSRDWKRNMAAERQKHRHGPPLGRRHHKRQLVANPDRVVEVKAQRCGSCQADLAGEAGELLAVNQITEIPPAQAEVIEVRQYRVLCPQCGSRHVARPPAGLEMKRRFGARLEALVVYYRQEQHLSYKRAQEVLHAVHGVTISQGGIDCIMQRARAQAVQEAEQVQAQVRQSGVVNSDETGSRVDGQNWWQWVFCTSEAVFHITCDNRSSDVIQDVLGKQQAEVWVSDCYSAQLKAPAQQRQICLAHQIRDLQGVIDRHPTCFWAQAMQGLFRAAIHLHHQRQELPQEDFQSRVARLERLCDWLAGRAPPQPKAAKLQRRYQKHREHLLVFLQRTDVSPTNNVSERALRTAVVHRKVLGGFRSEWGVQAYSALASVIDTAELNGKHAFQAIQDLFGSPALPIPCIG